jgi:hypothetical protein
MPTFLEAFIPALVGIASGAITLGARKLLTAVRGRHWLPLLQEVYLVVDPLLDKYLPNWSGSTIDFVLELAFLSVGDGELTPSELKYAVNEAKERFRPDIAKTHALDPNTPEGAKALEIADMVMRLQEGGVTREALLELAMKSAPIIERPKIFGLF